MKEINDLDVEDMWFQQDDTICHTTTETMLLVQAKIDDYVI